MMTWAILSDFYIFSYAFGFWRTGRERKDSYLLSLIPKFSFILCLAEHNQFFMSEALSSSDPSNLARVIAVNLCPAFNSEGSSITNFGLNTSETSPRHNFWRWYSFPRLKLLFFFFSHTTSRSLGLFSIVNDYIQPGLSVDLFLFFNVKGGEKNNRSRLRRTSIE